MNLTVVSMLLGKAQRAGEYNDVTMMLWVQRTYHCVQHKLMCDAHAAEALPFSARPRGSSSRYGCSLAHRHCLMLCASYHDANTLYKSIKSKALHPKRTCKTWMPNATCNVELQAHT